MITVSWSNGPVMRKGVIGLGASGCCGCCGGSAIDIGSGATVVLTQELFRDDSSVCSQSADTATYNMVVESKSCPCTVGMTDNAANKHDGFIDIYKEGEVCKVHFSTNGVYNKFQWVCAVSDAIYEVWDYVANQTTYNVTRYVHFYYQVSPPTYYTATVWADSATPFPTYQTGWAHQGYIKLVVTVNLT